MASAATSTCRSTPRRRSAACTSATTCRAPTCRRPWPSSTAATPRCAGRPPRAADRGGPPRQKMGAQPKGPPSDEPVVSCHAARAPEPRGIDKLGDLDADTLPVRQVVTDPQGHRWKVAELEMATATQPAARCHAAAQGRPRDRTPASSMAPAAKARSCTSRYAWWTWSSCPASCRGRGQPGQARAQHPPRRAAPRERCSTASRARPPSSRLAT